MILHIPHASRIIPKNLREQIVLSDDSLNSELIMMTDAYTDELFVARGASKVRFPISRLLVDVERFPDDAKEPMSKKGMGMIYTRTAQGDKLKRMLKPKEIQTLKAQYYMAHHRTLLDKVRGELSSYGNAIIVDCHSFPSKPLPCDQNKSTPRPDFCIGSDMFHTPKALVRLISRNIRGTGYSVGINRPYKGALVPIVFYKRTHKVSSIMIEVSRNLYMNETTGKKTAAFESIKLLIRTILQEVSKYQKTMPVHSPKAS